MSFAPEQIAEIFLQFALKADDGQQRFEYASAAAGDSHLRTLLTSYADQRAQLAAELRREVSHLAPSPAVKTLNDLTAVQGSDNCAARPGATDDASILAAMIEGDADVLGRYEAVLEESLPRKAAQIFRRQAAAVAAARDRMLELAHA